MQNQINRFSFPENYDKWFGEVLKTKEFLIKRQCIIAGQFMNEFHERITVENCRSEEIEVSELGLHPNPNNGEFTLTFYSSETAPAYITIYNQSGQIVSSFNQVIIQEENRLKYNLPNLPNDLLYISVGTENQLFGAKLIKREW
jgi:hypothetical protein